MKFLARFAVCIGTVADRIQEGPVLHLLDPATGEWSFLARMPRPGAWPIYSPERSWLIEDRRRYHLAQFPNYPHLHAYDLASETTWQLTSSEGVGQSEPSLAGDVLAFEARARLADFSTDVYLVRLK